MEISLTETQKEAKRVIDNIDPAKLHIIFHHPECRAMFEKRVDAYRLIDTPVLNTIRNAFKNHIIATLSFTELNLLIDEFAAALTKEFDEVHTGVVLLAIRLIRGSKISVFSTYSDEQLIQLYRNCMTVEQQIEDATKPIKEEVIEEFWTNATFKQIKEVEDMYNRRKAQDKKIPSIIQ